MYTQATTIRKRDFKYGLFIKTKTVQDKNKSLTNLYQLKGT